MDHRDPGDENDCTYHDKLSALLSEEDLEDMRADDRAGTLQGTDEISPTTRDARLKKVQQRVDDIVDEIFLKMEKGE